jgi:uncharacterized BrkB/YihY/UPF0761 family membrane protein
MLVLMILGLAVLYRYAPSRRVAKWRWISVGSVLAALACLAVSSLFSWYLGNFANYNATYGALGAVVGLMMWMWLSTLVVLVGAELNSEIEHQTAQDSTVGPAKPPEPRRGHGRYRRPRHGMTHCAVDSRPRPPDLEPPDLPRPFCGPPWPGSRRSPD